MIAKDYLSQARSIQILIEAMSEQLAFLKETAKYITPCLSSMPKLSCSINKTEDSYIRVIEKEEQIKALYRKLDEINKTICSVIDPVRQAILIKRYLSNKSWNAISEETTYSKPRIYELHRDALAEIDEMLKRS